MIKDPDAVLDYAWDWTAWLADGETITQADVIAEDGITVDSKSNTPAVVTAWLSGGTLDQAYEVTCRITTSQGRTDDRSIILQVSDR